MLNKVTGQDAVSVVVGLNWRSSGVAVREVMRGIDVDNAGRSYEHTYDSTVADMYWTILNYLSGTKSPVSEYFSAETDESGLPVCFYIHTDLDDCESRGIRYEFTYI